MNAAQPALAVFPPITSDTAALAETLGWVLLHFLWQGAVVAAVLSGILMLLRRRPATLRYHVCCAALLLMAATPPVTFWSLGGLEGLNGIARGGDIAGGSPGPDVLSPADLPFVPVAAEAVAPRPAQHPVAASTGAPLWAGLVLAWACGVAALSLWRLGGWFWLRRLLRRTDPVGPAWERTLAELAARLGVTRPVRLVRAAWVQVPAVVGVLRPVVLLPAAAVTGLTPGQLEALLAHELAHVRRLDYLVNLAQSVLETVLFYHPAVWWVSARVREERENCCDDLAAEATGGAAAYAEALAAMEALRLRDALPAHLALAARGAGGDGALLRRVRRLLGFKPGGAGAGRTRAGLRFRSMAAALVAVGCLLVPLTVAQMARAAKDDGAGAPADKASSPSDDEAAAKASGKPGKEAGSDDIETRDPNEEDLAGDASDYRIGPNDLLSVTINDLQGPGVQTVVSKRVSATGKISLPYVGEMSVRGESEAELEKSIVAAYRDGKLIQHANVSVAVIEARGRAFRILGAAEKPGQYAVTDNDFRILDVLALSQTDLAKKGVTEILVLRKPPEPATGEDVKNAKDDGGKGKPTWIRIPADRLMAGDPKANIAIRPGDTVVLRAPEPAAAAGAGAVEAWQVVVAADGLTLRGGGKTDWDAVSAELQKIPAAARGRTALVITPASEDLTLRQWNQAQRRAGELVKQHGLRDLLVLPATPAAAPAAGR